MGTTALNQNEKLTYGDITMLKEITIDGRKIGDGHPIYVIAEMSANHNREFNTAAQIIKEAKKAGADAVKLQTYTPDTMTLNCNRDEYRIKSGLWAGQTLYELYKSAYMHWEWQPELKRIADDEGITLFSTPFDVTAVDFLEEMDVPAYKVASFEAADMVLIKRIIETGKPVIISTGMVSFEELSGIILPEFPYDYPVALLHCVSEYPAKDDFFYLPMVLKKLYGLPTGVSDHTIAGCNMYGLCEMDMHIWERHVCLEKDKAHVPDGAFSSDMGQLKKRIQELRGHETPRSSIQFARSIIATADIKKGEPFTTENVRALRPGYGLEPYRMPGVLRSVAATDIERGTPITWGVLE